MPHDDDGHRSSKHKKTSDHSGEHRHKKHKRDRDDDAHKSKKRKHDSKHDGDGGKERKSRKDRSRVDIIDENPDEDVWIEKNIDVDGEFPLATDIPTAESLKLKSRAYTTPNDPELPPTTKSESSLKRDDWMLEPAAPSNSNASTSKHTLQLPSGNESLTDDYGEPSEGARTLGGGVDFFSSLGTARQKKPKEDKPDPEKLKISSKELNTQLRDGKSLAEYTTTPTKAIVPGGPGSQWRIMKLRRVYETAEDEGKSVEEVALERYGSLEAFEEAKEERRIIDERENRRAERGRGKDSGQRREGTAESNASEMRYVFSDLAPGSGASSRSASFRRPGGSTPATPSPAPPHDAQAPANRRVDALRGGVHGAKTPLSQSRTPIPSAMSVPVTPAGGKRALSPSSLNKLQAKVLRAKLMGAPDAEELEKQFEEERRRAESGQFVTDDKAGSSTRVEVLPTLDAQGRMYDVGTGKADDREHLPGNRKRKDKVETRDPKTGEIVRFNADDDEITLGEMLRQEKFGAGMADQKDMDAEFARAIMGDGKFENDLEYIDDNAEKLGRKKMRSDAMKRQFAINDYKKTQKVLATCQFCYGEDDSPPKAAVIAMGTRCYLACTLNQELVEGHCCIVPIPHHLSMLEGDDDTWDEVRNFMKCLMRMYAEEDKGVVFYETVVSIKSQRHTFIECVPVLWEHFEQLPGFFRESILASETEWSQHKKLIDFAARPGGFRRAMVPNLPYFMVQFDHKGEKGFGHVIEGTSEAAGLEDDIDEGEKGGGEFPRWFAAEIIGNLLDLEPRRWRRPKRIDMYHNRERVAAFRKKYDRFDWTGMIGQS